MNRRMLFQRLAGFVAAVGLLPAIQAGPPWPKLTVAASWDHGGYTDWSDGTRTFRPPLKLEDATIAHQILPVAHHYGFTVNEVMAMDFMVFHRYLDDMRGAEA